MTDSFEREMATPAPDREKQRLIKEIQLRSEKLRLAPKAQKERLAKELEASRTRLKRVNGSPEGEV